MNEFEEWDIEEAEKEAIAIQFQKQFREGDAELEVWEDHCGNKGGW